MQLSSSWTIFEIGGVSKSVHCLYSGGGAYVQIHHELFKAHNDWTPEDCEFAYRSLTMAYNSLITEIEEEFFRSTLSTGEE